ncbi:MAG TPA: hypothetical protein DG084_01235 [Gemmatimonadetes bacterium]|nr:hypothetical protein [Gemmatimonadota bacterium]|tara:strand:- start:3184 stop:3609 length:426 start_codon:yes stop_codon:yes gene_type:complete
MKPSSFIAFAFVLAGCSGTVEVDFQVTVQSVDTIVAQASTQVICDVVVTATAVGDDGQFGRFGEADFTFRSLASGEVLGSESVSSAVMSTEFRSQVVESGSTINSQPIQRLAEEGFYWDFIFYYRNPAGSRSFSETTVSCG